MSLLKSRQNKIRTISLPLKQNLIIFKFRRSIKYQNQKINRKKEIMKPILILRKQCSR